VVVIVGELLTVMESDWVAFTPLASVTCTVKVSLTADEFTVPLMAPDELSVSPAGSVPEASDQVRGDVPPVAARVCE
jgi:hypothetical protein